MRFLACIQPFICRSKSSRRRRSCCLPALDDAQRASCSPPPPVSIVSSEKNGAANGKVEVFPAGILKKSGGPGSKEAGKGRVKWMDFLGKELVEIREFEPIESGESEKSIKGNRFFWCVIQ